MIINLFGNLYDCKINIKMILAVFWKKWVKIHSHFSLIWTLKMIISLPLYNYFWLNTLVTLLSNFKNFKLTQFNPELIQSFFPSHSSLVLCLCFFVFLWMKYLCDFFCGGSMEYLWDSFVFINGTYKSLNIPFQY